MTLEADVAIASGSELQIEEESDSLPALDCANISQITVQAGGTLFVDDLDGSTATYDDEHNSVFSNQGTISIQGAVGATTEARFVTDLGGPGVIDIDGNGADPSATTAFFNGNVLDQAITASDATVTVQDDSNTIDDGTDASFDVSGGSFTFAGDATLVLHQPGLTASVYDAKTGTFVQRSDHLHPFTTPISGFAAGDTITLEGHFVSGDDDVAVWRAATHTLVVERLTINPTHPQILATLTLLGNYSAGDFVLTGNPSTHDLTLTYGSGKAHAAPSGPSALGAELARLGTVADLLPSQPAPSLRQTFPERPAPLSAFSGDVARPFPLSDFALHHLAHG